MALLMVMTVCLLVYAALEYRIRTVLKEQEATFPDQKGKRIQTKHAGCSTTSSGFMSSTSRDRAS